MKFFAPATNTPSVTSSELDAMRAELEAMRQELAAMRASLDAKGYGALSPSDASWRWEGGLEQTLYAPSRLERARQPEPYAASLLSP